MGKEGLNFDAQPEPQEEGMMVGDTYFGKIGDGSGHETEFIDLSEPTAETMSAWQGTVDRAPEVATAGDVMVGENLVRPSTARRDEDIPDHFDLPIGEAPVASSDVYNRMVDRPGFPPASQEVDLELP